MAPGRCSTRRSTRMPPSAEPGARRTAGPRSLASWTRPLALAAAASVVAAACLGNVGPGIERTADPAACPELTLDPLPVGHTEVARKRLLPDRAISPLRVDLRGPGGRELTLLSGSTGDLGGLMLARRPVLGADARLVRTPAGTFALLWLDPIGGEDCPEYGLVANGYAQVEVEAMIPALELLRPD